MPDTDQDEIASWLLTFVSDAQREQRLSDDQLEEIHRRLDEYHAGLTAPVDDGAVTEFWTRCCL